MLSLQFKCNFSFFIAKPKVVMFQYFKTNVAAAAQSAAMKAINHVASTFAQVLQFKSKQEMKRIVIITICLFLSGVSAFSYGQEL